MSHSVNDVACVHGNMLNTRGAVEVNVLLDLTLSPVAWGWLIKWHLDSLIIITHNNGIQRTVISVHLWIVGALFTLA